MFRFFTLAILLLVGCIATSFGQVNVTSTGGTVSASYATLKAAFDAVNNGTHTGSIGMTLTANTTETASAVLFASGTGSSLFTDLSIQPSGAIVVSGAIAGHLIDLNGADNVNINGLNASGNSLTFINTSTISSSVIRFFGDATNNTVTNCTLQGSSTIFGVVYFGGGTATGNDNNTVSNCDIGPAGSNNPLYGIYSMGTSAAIDNSNNSVVNNNIFDYFNASSSTSGMNINSGNSGWTITGNKLFQTANRTYTSASTHYGINITSGSGYTISDNTIGFANAGGTGTTNMMGLTSGSLGGTFPSAYTVGGAANATKYIAINCAFTSGGAVSSIQNNTIAGFALYTSSSTSSTYGIFCGIGVSGGNVNIGTISGNKIGTSDASIYTACTSSGGAIAGIYVTSSNTVNIQNNVLQNLDAMGTSATTSGSINGINTEGAGGTFLVSGNTIGSTNNPSLRLGNLLSGTNLSNVGTTFSTASGTSLFQGIRNAQTGSVTIGTLTAPNIIRNVYLNSTGTLALFRGIYVSAGTATVTYNSISNITAPSGGTSYSSGGLAGIGILCGGSTNPNISNNTISGLNLTNTGTSGYTLAGIVLTSAVSSATISKNNISGLSNASTSTSATAPGTATGIFIREGGGAITTIDNNMISLGNGQTTNTTFMGIWAQYNTSTATALKIYYNTINIEGTVTAGAQPSMCLNRGDLSTTANAVFTIDAKNNIFNNTRSGGTGKQYAIANSYGATTSSTTGWGAGASNYNVLNSNASTIGYWSGDKTFSGWQASGSCDANSLSGVAISFVNTSSGDLHMNMGTNGTLIESAGTTIAGFTTDFDNDTRPGPASSVNGGATAPDPGADEFDGAPFLYKTFYVDMSTAQGFLPGTDQVYLTGTITGWIQPGDPGSILMTQQGTSLIYSATILVSPGYYEYKYFKNAGWAGGEWNGGTNRTVTITSTNTINDTWGGFINWANLQWPDFGVIFTGGSYNVYAQVFMDHDLTSAPGATYGLQAWIGYSTSNTDPSTWTNWVPAPFFGQSGSNDEFMADLGQILNSPGIYYYASRFQYGNMPYVYGGYNSGFWDGTTNVNGQLVINLPERTLNVHFLLEGLYDGAGLMRKAQNGAGDQFSGNVADQVTIELHDATDYTTIYYTVTNVNLTTDGTATISVPAGFAGSYYITVKHRNSIETTTANPVYFTGTTVEYSFNTASAAFGNNMLQSGGYSLIYGGDVNGDGLVDSSDMNAVDNDVTAFATGYLATDVNGDGLVDSSDMNLIDNNSSGFVSKVTP